eukprot:TRINITY_DN3669_c1_g1_i10.p2 TRINITY_DN3669_c1_g1~~TRINITY_DN3669_c1_g1_i10.p2  ORF type:complete len:135 (-),score=13.05 TRINITY_DN3669_c1_g1_i10:260-664(-)
MLSPASRSGTAGLPVLATTWNPDGAQFGSFRYLLHTPVLRVCWLLEKHGRKSGKRTGAGRRSGKTSRLAQDMEHGRVEVIDVDASSDTTTVSAASTITEETFSVSSDSSVEMLPSLTQQRLDDAAARRAAEGNS